jgi:hypothetical protein
MAKTAAASWLLVLAVTTVAADDGSRPRASLEVDAAEVQIGDRIPTTVTVELPTGARLVTRPLGPRLGPFSVFDSGWEEPLEGGDGPVYRWRGSLSAFETGQLELPSIRLEGEGPEGGFFVETAPRTIAVASVLAGEEQAQGQVELADIKPPVSVPPDYGPLRLALAMLVGLLLVALGVWWLQRRLAGRLSAVAVTDDPFRRMPPHEWIYQELQRLLDSRVAERGGVDTFYSEIARLLKQYLEGRYRVDLMESTTAEVLPRLSQTGAPREAIAAVERVLTTCDRVKFAGERPRPAEWRKAVEAVYGLVDLTKPVQTSDTERDRGVA